MSNSKSESYLSAAYDVLHRRQRSRRFGHACPGTNFVLIQRASQFVCVGCRLRFETKSLSASDLESGARAVVPERLSRPFSRLFTKVRQMLLVHCKQVFEVL
jgi:hypothetical protein